MTYLGRGKKKPAQKQLQLERGTRKHQAQWNRVRRCSRYDSRDSHAVFDKDHGEAGCPSATHRSQQWSRYPPSSHTLHQSMCMCPKKSVAPWKACTATGFWQISGAHIEAVSYRDLWHYGRAPWWNTSWRTTVCRSTHEEDHRELSSEGGTLCWIRGRVWRSSPEEETVAEKICDDLCHPHSLSPCADATVQKKVEKIRSEAQEEQSGFGSIFVKI